MASDNEHIWIVLLLQHNYGSHSCEAIEVKDLKKRLLPSCSPGWPVVGEGIGLEDGSSPGLSDPPWCAEGPGTQRPGSRSGCEPQARFRGGYAEVCLVPSASDLKQTTNLYFSFSNIPEFLISSGLKGIIF